MTLLFTFFSKSKSVFPRVGLTELLSHIPEMINLIVQIYFPEEWNK